MNAHKREWAFTGIIGLTHGAQHFFSRLIPPLIPIMAVELQLPLWKLGLLISVYQMGLGFGQAPLGVLSDRYDRRYLLGPGLAVLGGSYVLFGLAPSMGGPIPDLSGFGYTLSGPFLVMCLAMAIGGFGSAVVHPTGYPLITANVGEDKKGKALGVWGAAAKLGDAASPALIAVLILVLVWNEILLGVAGVVVAVLLFALLSLDEFDTLPPEHASNIEEDDEEDAADEETVWTADKRLFVYPMVAVLLFFTMRMIATQGVNTFVPAFITEVYSYTFTLFGMEFAPESFANFYFSLLLITAAVVQLATGTVTDLYDHRKVLLVFLGASTVALGVLSMMTLGPLPLLIVLLVIGGGLWGLNPARDALVSEISPEEREGRTFGYLWTVTHIIGSLSPVFIGFIAELSGIQSSFRWLALATLLSALSIGLLFSDRVYVRSETAATGRATSD